MNKNQTNYQSDNRKALPKFLIIILIGFVFGILSYTIISFINSGNHLNTIAMTLNDYFISFAPYAMWVLMLIFLGLATYFYCQAHKLFINWDGEDEETIDQAEMKINYVIFFTSFESIINFMLFATFKFQEDIASFLILLSGFILSLILETVIQQKAVDLTRKINPEKKGSVYDTKFQKIWLESCDENEIRQIGQASYKAFVATNTTCIVLWLVTLLLSTVMPIGMYPIIVITIIWAVATIVYFVEAIRISK